MARRWGVWKNDVKGIWLFLMLVVFFASLPQILDNAIGAVFGAVWAIVAMLGAWSVYLTKKEERRKARLARVFAFKKKLRTSKREVRSRITVRLKG